MNIEGDENVLLEVDNLEDIGADTPHLGLASSGTDEKIIATLQRAGSLDVSDAANIAAEVAEEVKE